MILQQKHTALLQEAERRGATGIAPLRRCLQMLSLATILWSVLRVRELPLDEAEQAELAGKPLTVGATLAEIRDAIREMPRPMRQLAGAMLCQWYAMFAYWQYITFAVGRSQELLYWFARQWDEWKMSRWKIFLDSPMAMRVVEVYGRHERLFDEDAQAVWNGRPHPFKLPNLQLTPEVAQSQAINNVRGGAIIIAGSGMCNGGRVRHHLRQNLGRKQSHVMFVGYQARGTLGRRLVDGDRCRWLYRR